MDLMTASTLSQYINVKNVTGTVVTGPGRYVTRSGETVTVERLGGYGGLWAYGRYDNGVRESWFVSGRIFTVMLSPNDIVRSA
jgi:hypothetical protein